MFGPGWSTTTPRSRSVSAMTRTSSISGTFVKRQRSPVSVAAASILRAAFLAPLMRTSPCSGRPPSIRNTSRVTASGTYSQWNGLASAMAPPMMNGQPQRCLATRSPSAGATRLLATWARTAGSLMTTALGDADAEQRLLERGARRGQVRWLVVARFERPFGLAARLLGALEIDLGGHVRHLGHHDDLVRPDLDEATRDGEVLLAAARPDPQLADAEHRHERGVVGQDPQLALATRDLDGVDLAGIGKSLRRDDLEQDRHGSSPAASRRSCGRPRSCRRGRRPARAACPPCPRGPP